VLHTLVPTTICKLPHRRHRDAITACGPPSAIAHQRQPTGSVSPTGRALRHTTPASGAWRYPVHGVGGRAGAGVACCPSINCPKRPSLK
jgi:hypothetical protein